MQPYLTRSEARRAHANNNPVGETRQGEGFISRGCREGSSPVRVRRRRYYRIGHYGGRHPLGVFDRVALLLAYNRTLPAGERVRWRWALLSMVALFVAATGWSAVL